VKILVSGGLDEPEIENLKDLADGFGVGTSLSNAPVINFAMDIVEVAGRPFAKRGKRSGIKQVIRCPRCGRDEIIPAKAKAACSCGGKARRLLRPLLRQGRLVATLPEPRAIRRAVLEQLRRGRDRAGAGEGKA